MNIPSAILIPAHNRRATTLACLHRLRLNGDFERGHVVVVDDGSTDGTNEAVHSKHPAVEVLRGNGNLWWTGAIALGMTHAFKRGALAVICLNDDCLPRPGALAALLGYIEQHPHAVAGPVAIDSRTGVRLAEAFSGRRTLPPPAPAEICTASGLSGYCLAVPRPVWERLGAPDSCRFPHYGGDTAYTLRASQNGFTVVVVGAAEVELNDYHVRTSSPGIYRDPTAPWQVEWRRTFINPKSPFRMATQWHLLNLKYGWFAGGILAGVRLSTWAARFFLRQ